MRLPRFRLRTLMIAVAVAAVVLYGLHLYHLRRHYQAIATDYARRERVVNMNIVRLPELQEKGFIFSEARSQEFRDEDAAKLRRKYERAARYPWLPFPPDPPAPK